MPGVYVHIPFCSSFCIYCDFYSIVERDKKVEVDYVDSLLREVDNKSDFFGDSKISTLYFGGGTPSLLPVNLLEKIVDKIETVFGHPAEFTVEVNPDDITIDYAKSLKSLGVSRISMGVQSFDDAHLKWMRRRHSCSEAINSFNILRKCGFENISLDLIFGYCPSGIDTSQGESMRSWREDIRKILQLHPEHISAYQMSIEPGSALGAMASSRCGNALYREPSQELCAAQYSTLQEKLCEAGYLQYEISNFSLPGMESKHNSSYWNRDSYLGIGAAAHSFRGRVRSWNPSDLCAYIRGENCGSEELTDEQIFQEKVMLGLRKAGGFSLTPSEERALSKKIADLEKRGLLIYEDGNIRIPLNNLFISDYIIGELL